MNIPYVGQLVDFYPSESQRHAAIVTEVNSPNSSASLQRPNVSLLVFPPGEQPEVWTDVPGVDDEDEMPTLTECWGFQHEFNLQQSEDVITDAKGTETNEFVGEVNQATS